MKATSALHFIRLANGGHNEAYHLMLHRTIELLSNYNTPSDQTTLLRRSNPFFIENYNEIFEYQEDLYEEVLHIWPIAKLMELKDRLKESSRYDKALEVYRESHFGVFLANTKSLTHLYERLQPSWNNCFEVWSEENAQLLQPYTGTSSSKTKLAIRQVTNEVILHPKQYHEDAEAFKSLVQDHQKMLLA